MQACARIHLIAHFLSNQSAQESFLLYPVHRNDEENICILRDNKTHAALFFIIKTTYFIRTSFIVSQFFCCLQISHELFLISFHPGFFPSATTRAQFASGLSFEVACTQVILVFIIFFNIFSFFGMLWQKKTSNKTVGFLQLLIRPHLFTYSLSQTHLLLQRKSQDLTSPTFVQV